MLNSGNGIRRVKNNIPILQSEKTQYQLSETFKITSPIVSEVGITVAVQIGV